MTGVDKLELPQFSIVELRLVSREVRFTTGETVNKMMHYNKCLLLGGLIGTVFFLLFLKGASFRY